MSTADPISLAQAQRLAANADTILLRATRPADLETPIGAFLRLDDGGPAYLLESVEGGERLGRYSFLGVGPRRLLEVSGGQARIQTRPVDGADLFPRPPDRDGRGGRPAGGHPRVRAASPRPADRRHAAVHRRRASERSRTTPSPRSSRTVPLPERDPVGVPMASFIETDLVLVFDHLTHTLSAIASLHTDAPDLEGRYRIAEEAIFDALDRTARPSAAELNGRPRPVDGPARPRDRSRQPRSVRPIETSLGRDEYIHAVEVAKDAIAAGEAIQVVLARRQSFELPADPATGTHARRHRALPRAPPGQPEPLPLLHPDADVRGGRAPRRSCCSRSRATG